MIWGDDLMNTKCLKVYFNKTYKNIHKLLFLREEDCPTLMKCIDNLVIELCGADDLLWENYYFAQLIFNVQALKMVDEYTTFKSQVFKCLKLCDSLSKQLDKEVNVDGLL